MNRALQFLVLISVLIISFSHNSEAQKRSNRDIDEYFDDRGSFKDRLWYGADVTLNFFSVPGGNAFNAGIAPMVGYKITDAFSVGPRIEILYRGERYDINTGTDLKFNSTNYGVGAFTRLKVFNQYLRDVRIPIFEYEVNEGELKYRWNNVIKGFDMPLDISLDNKSIKLFPVIDWKYLKTIEGNLEINNNYYVDYNEL